MVKQNAPHYKVLITTSGIGSRLGELTKYTNKALVRVGNKPVLSYIIEAYPKNIELVITVGYFADQIKEFIKFAYPDRKITFVDINNYDGPGSSLAYSMLQAKNYLQCPFIYHASDTIVNEPISPPTKNWNGGFRGKDAATYSSFDIIGDKVQLLKDKGATDFDFLHIGLVGIKDYRSFWQTLEKVYQQNANDRTLNDCRVINTLIKNGVDFSVKEFTSWYDIGNAESLNQARKNLGKQNVVLDKIDETIFIFDDFVIKFFYDQKKVVERVARAKLLKNLVPKIEKVGKNFYRYKYIEGELLSRAAKPSNFLHFLSWARQHLWKEKKEITDDKFKKICYDFYISKTYSRLKDFYVKKNITDASQKINGEMVPTITEIFKHIDVDWLSQAKQSQFHGDFIPDNIIKTKNNYFLLDWRQNFGGLLKAGDMYYDLAKLNHNLTVNHDIVNANLFTVNMNDNEVYCEIMRKNNLVECQEIYHQFLIDNHYNLHKVKVLTAIIWLNMSPLHHHPFDLFLYYFGKLHLWRLVNQKK